MAICLTETFCVLATPVGCPDDPDVFELCFDKGWESYLWVTSLINLFA